MKIATNPFILNEIPIDRAFCDREKELADFISYADSNTKVVLYSPRRYGKTSLIKRVQHQLASKGFITAYCDLFGITSIEEIAGRITRSVFEVTHSQESLFKKVISFIQSFRPVMAVNERGEMSVSVQPAFKKAGLDTLDETMRGLNGFISQIDQPMHIVLDEFQELSEIKNSIAIEGILRSHIQHLPVSFVFIGSRRRLLLEMFNDRKRPFFQSAINYELGPLPLNDLINYIVGQFRDGNKIIKTGQSEKIAELVNQHPGYVQKLCFFLFDISGKSVNGEDIFGAYDRLLSNEKPYFESILQGLSNKQISLLTALAKEPEGKIYSADFMSRHNLGSSGGIQNSISVLDRRDFIEQVSKKQTWSVVDPLFKVWLTRLSI